MSDVFVETQGHVVLVEFANGQVNYFTAELLDGIADELDRAHEAGARAVVLGSRGRHFCAGADFSAIGPSVEERGATADRAYAAGLRIFAQPLPVVAAVQGAAIGGGLGLACAADLRVVAPDTRLEANFTRLGFHPGFGLTAVLPHLVGRQAAFRMLVEAQRLDGVEAHAIGLADVVVEREALLAAALEVAGELACRAPLAAQAVRETLRRDLLRQVEAALVREAAEQRRLWATDDAAIGMGAAQRREAPVFIGR